MSATLALKSTSPTDVRSTLTDLGHQIWRVESDFVPLIALAFTIAGGAAQDPPGRGGTAQMLARLLDEGAGPYNSDAFQERLAERAIELSFSAGPDAISGSLKTLVDHRDEAFDLLRLAVTEPRFDDDAIERVRAQTLAGIRYQTNDPSTIATNRFLHEAFPDHAYGRPVSGTLESVAAVTRDDLVSMHRRMLARDGLKIAAVGEMSEGELARRIDGVFGGLPALSDIQPVEPRPLVGLGSRVVVDLDVPQSVVRFGTHGVSRRDPDFTATFVLNHILGGGAFTSRLFQEVRERRGLAYSVGTSLVTYRGSAMTWGYTATKNERVAECLEVIGAEMGRLGREGPSDDELAKAKDYLTGSYPLSFDTSTKIAHQLAQIAFEELGIDYITRRNAMISAVTQDDLRRAAARTIGDGTMLVVVAGRPIGLELKLARPGPIWRHTRSLQQTRGWRRVATPI
jgi:zinc protease